MMIDETMRDEIIKQYARDMLVKETLIELGKIMIEIMRDAPSMKQSGALDVSEKINDFLISKTSLK